MPVKNRIFFIFSLDRFLEDFTWGAGTSSMGCYPTKWKPNTMLALANRQALVNHQMGRTPHSDGRASGDMFCRMKIKQAAELTFDEPVNQPILSVTRTAIQLRQPMRQPVSPPETGERVQAVKDFKEKNEF